jgi:hypothetical protein
MKTTSPNVLRVRTKAQKIMFDDEMSGQISDGQWENTSPDDHWLPWSDATVIVDPSNVGRNFQCPKDNYALNSSDLLSIVGDRMLKYVQQGGYEHPDPELATPGFTWERMRRELADLRVIMKCYNPYMPAKPELPSEDEDLAADVLDDTAPDEVVGTFNGPDYLAAQPAIMPEKPPAPKPLTVDLAAHALGDALHEDELQLCSAYADTGNGAAFVVRDQSGQQFLVTMVPMK